jgi:hypothetical protein
MMNEVQIRCTAPTRGTVYFEGLARLCIETSRNPRLPRSFWAVLKLVPATIATLQRNDERRGPRELVSDKSVRPQPRSLRASCVTRRQHPYGHNCRRCGVLR